MVRKRGLRLTASCFQISSRTDHRYPFTSWGGTSSRSEPFHHTSCRSFQQVSHSQQVINCGCPGEHPFHPLTTAVANLAHQADGLHPAEDLFHSLALLRAESVTRMARSAFINRTAAVCIVLRHMRRNP